jgi:hypothetical protein
VYHTIPLKPTSPERSRDVLILPFHPAVVKLASFISSVVTTISPRHHALYVHPHLHMMIKMIVMTVMLIVNCMNVA